MSGRSAKWELALQIWEDEGGALGGIRPDKEFDWIDEAAEPPTLLSNEQYDSGRTKATQEAKSIHRDEKGQGV